MNGLEIVNRPVPGKYDHSIFRVTDNSMDDGTLISIIKGSEVEVREYDMTGGKPLPIHNELFVIVTDTGIVLRQIVEHNRDKGYIRCHAYNSHWDDYDIPCDDIVKMYIYVRIVASRPFIPPIDYIPGMSLEPNQDIHMGKVVHIAREYDYYNNPGTPDQTRWIAREFIEGGSTTLSTEDWDRLDEHLLTLETMDSSTIKYEDLESMANDPAIPALKADQYKKMLGFLEKYIPDEGYRRQTINQHDNLFLDENGFVKYSEIGPL